MMINFQHSSSENKLTELFRFYLIRNSYDCNDSITFLQQLVSICIFIFLLSCQIRHQHRCESGGAEEGSARFDRTRCRPDRDCFVSARYLSQDGRSLLHRERQGAVGSCCATKDCLVLGTSQRQLVSNLLEILFSEGDTTTCVHFCFQ